MKYHHTIIILGIWTATIPVIGFPFVLQKPLLIITGTILLFIGIVMYQEKIKREEKKVKTKRALDKEKITPKSKNNPSKDTINFFSGHLNKH